MRKLAARLGTHVVNHAIVIGIEKRTRHALQDIIVVLVDTQILVDELLRFLPEVFGDAFDIGRRKQRPRCLAAIGALQTIGTPKLLVVQFLHHIIEVLGRLLFEFVEVLFVLGMLIFGQPTEYVNLWICQFIDLKTDAANLRNK